MASLVHPLNKLLQAGSTWNWTEECRQAFDAAKKQLTSATKGIPSLAATRLPRWALQLAAHNYTIELRPTKVHANADALSRLPLKGTKSEGSSNADLSVCDDDV